MACITDSLQPLIHLLDFSRIFLAGCFPAYLETPFPAFITEMCNSQKIKGTWFATLFLAVFSGVPAELYYPCLFQGYFQSKLFQPFDQVFKHLIRCIFALYTDDKIITVAHHAHVTSKFML